MICKEITNVDRDIYLCANSNFELSNYKNSDEERQKFRIERLKKLKPKPSSLFGYVDI
jgi:hypothetical protein